MGWFDKAIGDIAKVGTVVGKDIAHTLNPTNPPPTPQEQKAAQEAVKPVVTDVVNVGKDIVVTAAGAVEGLTGLPTHGLACQDKNLANSKLCTPQGGPPMDDPDDEDDTWIEGVSNEVVVVAGVGLVATLAIVVIVSA